MRKFIGDLFLTGGVIMFLGRIGSGLDQLLIFGIGVLLSKAWNGQGIFDFDSDGGGSNDGSGGNGGGDGGGYGDGGGWFDGGGGG